MLPLHNLLNAHIVLRNEKHAFVFNVFTIWLDKYQSMQFLHLLLCIQTFTNFHEWVASIDYITTIYARTAKPYHIVWVIMYTTPRRWLEANTSRRDCYTNVASSLID